MTTLKLLTAIQTECALAQQSSDAEQAKHLYAIQTLAALLTEDTVSTAPLVTTSTRIETQPKSSVPIAKVTSDYSGSSLLDF